MTQGENIAGDGLMCKKVSIGLSFNRIRSTTIARIATSIKMSVIGRIVTSVNCLPGI